ncbi:MAG: S9 family peptidase [Chloroflexota bacterium]
MSQKRSIQPRDLYRLRLISDPQIAPDATRIVFVRKEMSEEKNQYVSNIHMVDREGTVTQFTAGGKDSAPRWSPDGKWLAFLSGRTEKPQLHVISTLGGEAFALTDRKFGAGVPAWSPDGKYLAFAGAVPMDAEEENEDEGGKDPKKKAKTKVVRRSSYKLDGAGYIGDRRRHLFVVDVQKRAVEQVTDGDCNDDNPQWSPDGEHIVFTSNRDPRWDVSTGRDLYILPRAGGTARQVSHDGAFGTPAFSHDGSRIAMVGSTDHHENMGPRRLYSIDRAGGDLREEGGDWDAEVGYNIISDVVQADDGMGLRWRDDGIYFIGTARGEANIYRASGGSVHPITEGKHAITDWSVADDGTIALSLADSTHPAEIYLWQNGEYTQLTHENDAWLEEVLVSRPERISYAGADREESEGWLLSPAGASAGKHPLIVYLHGGPAFSYGEAFFFEYQYLHGQGFGVWFPNIHGSSTYGRAYHLSIRGDWGNLDYQDVLAGTDVAAAREWVDPERLGVIGGSYGGYMTSWVMGHTDRFRAAVAERVLCNLVNFFGTMDFGFAWNRQTGVYPEEDVQKLWEMSPIAHVQNVKHPMMVMHSEGDMRTPIEQGEQLFNVLRRLGKETKFVMFPEESHGLSRMGTPSRRMERMELILQWFKEKL